MILSFLTNPFANSRIGNRRFAKFTDEHRGRVRAAAGLPAGVTLALAAVDASYATFLAAEKTNAVASAVREGKTVTNDTAIRRLQRFVSQQAALLAGALRDPDTGQRGEDTALYQVFFPKGVTALTRADKADIETEANTFWEALKANPGYGVPDAAARFKALLDDVVASRTTQLGTDGKGGETATDAGRDAARTTLAVALYVLLLELLKHHAAAPAAVGQYYNLAIFDEGRAARKDDKRAANSAPAPDGDGDAPGVTP